MVIEAEVDFIPHGSAGDILGTCAIPLSAWCRRAVRLSGADGSGIVLRFADEMRFVAGSGFAWYDVPSIAPDESLFGAVFTSRRSVVCADVERDPSIASRLEAQVIGIGAFVACPLENTESFLGALVVHRKIATDWDPEQVRRLEGFSDALSLFMSGALQCRHFRMPGLRSVSSTRVALSPIARSAVTQAVFTEAGMIAKYSFPVLVLGERGTGKGVLAEHIHSLSGRAGPFISVNCAALPPDTIEDALFGHKKGAFTGAMGDRAGHVEAADGGTLFLDEIGDLPWGAQAKLLRLVERNEIQRLGEDTVRRVDVRIVAATNRIVSPSDANRVLREDLYDRLAGHVLTMPPLRQRREDLEALIDVFLHRTTVDLHRPVAGFTIEARDALLKHEWPGNIRELENVLRGACLRTRIGEAVGIDALRIDAARGGAGEESPNPLPAAETQSNRPRNVSEADLRSAFERHGGNISRIAADLHVTRQTVQRRLRTMGLR